MVLLTYKLKKKMKKKKTSSFLCANTWLAGAAFPPLLSTSDSISAWLLLRLARTSFTPFVFFFFLFSHLSHKLYPHHTWYIETTQTLMFSCSLTLLRRTSPPGKRHPLPHLWEERRMADGAVSTRVVFLDVNQTNETKGKKNQAYHCKIWNIQPSPALTSQRRIMLLPLSLCKKMLIKMFKLCIDDIPVFCGFV